MGAYWGNQWFRVEHEKLELCGIIMLSKYPTADGATTDGIENTFVPMPDVNNFEFFPCESKADAQHKAKLHTFMITHSKIIERVQPEATLVNEHHKYLEKTDRIKTDLLKNDIQSREEEIDTLRIEIKQLKRLRKAKVREFVESELISVDKGGVE
jgi:hypothetical protein